MAGTNHTESTQQGETEFEQRRAELVGQIGESLEQVLTQINALNRSLEGIIELGNQFEPIEALWSQFETVMNHEQQTSAPETNEHDDERNGGGTDK